MNQVQPFYCKLNETHPLKYYGYQVCRHGDMPAFDNLKQVFSKYIENSLRDFSSVSFDDNSFAIEKYHQVLADHNIDNHQFLRSIGRKLPESFGSHPFLQRMLKVATEKTGHDFRIYKNTVEFRVVRPQSDDNNPLHRDHWFPYFIPLVNVYIPLSGSYCNSSLCVVPFSHKWTDEEVKPTFTYEESANQGKKSVKANGVQTSVPEIAESIHEIKCHRPDVLEGDFMLFSPTMVHGGADNGSFDTRFSLEIRLETEAQ